MAAWMPSRVTDWYKAMAAWVPSRVTDWYKG